MAHLIGSSTQVLGYSELHLSYGPLFSLLRMRFAVALSTHRWPFGIHLLDKIVHNEHSISQDFLEREDLRLIFMLREPTHTLRSLIQMSCQTGVTYYTSLENAADYYCRRLYILEQYASKVDAGQAVFVESDDLIYRSRELLSRLTEWLGLAEPLTEQYQQFPRTGSYGAGDPMQSIRAGTIVRRAPITILREAETEPLIDLALKSYHACSAAMGRFALGSASSLPQPT